MFGKFCLRYAPRHIYMVIVNFILNFALHVSFVAEDDELLLFKAGRLEMGVFR